MMRNGTWQVFDGQGRRKYLTEEEAERFLIAARSLPPSGHALCLLLAYSGCRISEALAVTRAHLGQGTVTLRTLKRRKTVFRTVHLPRRVMRQLTALPSGHDTDTPLSHQHRATAYRWVKQTMELAGIEGSQAMPKGLRHGFGIKAALNGVPPNLIQRWLGHASPETTAVYLDAVGSEERAFAKRLWHSS